jgi:hypothetical protein
MPGNLAPSGGVLGTAGRAESREPARHVATMEVPDP